MELFGKKKEKGIPVLFYDGKLSGFQCNYPCQILLDDNFLHITRIKPDVEVNLDKSRIISIDIFLKETEYMAKYKGTSIETGKGTPKQYFVINYVSKSGEHEHLDFWCTALEMSKIMKMRDELIKQKEKVSYEI